MKKLLLTALGCAAVSLAAGQAQVISDNFTTSQGATFTTSGAIGTSDWSVTRAGDDWGARIDNGILTLTNDATGTANASGWVLASRTLTSSGHFNTTLAASGGLVTWSLNMQQIRTDPAGFSTVTSYGAAYILGGTNAADPRQSGSGYAIVLGQSGATDPIRLATYDNGIAGTLTDIIVASAPLNDVGAEHLSLQITYNPADHTWTLSGRNDGVAFVDPTTGSLSSLGSVVNSTYTGTNLTVTGAFWQGSTGANQTATFDNISIVAVPEPSTALLVGLGAGVFFLRRRFAGGKA